MPRSKPLTAPADPAEVARYRERIRAGCVTDRNGCWVWQGSVSRFTGTQHGQLRAWTGRSALKTHRLAYVLWNGPLEAGDVVRHRCPGGANSLCCHPEHLTTGTQGENNHDTRRDGNLPAGGHVSDDGAADILQEHYVHDVRNVDLANRYGVQPSAISKILHGRTHRQVYRELRPGLEAEIGVPLPDPPGRN